MTPVFLHGWGFDAAFWLPVRQRLSGAALDRGYFGARQSSFPQGPLLLVGHSLGALLWLLELPAAVCGLVAINGFDRFSATAGWPGVAPRTLQQMIKRFDEAPDEVLHQFRSRCGAPPPPPIVDRNGLCGDLELLLNADARAAASRLTIPVLALNGGDDPILPLPLHGRSFESAPEVTRLTRGHSGHLLPLSDPDWCAETIRSFAARLA